MRIFEYIIRREEKWKLLIKIEIMIMKDCLNKNWARKKLMSSYDSVAGAICESRKSVEFFFAQHTN